MNQGCGHTVGHGHDFVEAQGPLLDLGCQRLAANELEHLIEHAIRLTCVDSRNNVRVIERSTGADLLEKPISQARLHGGLRPNDFQSHHPPSQCVFSPVYRAHATFADLGNQTVATQDSTQLHGSWRLRILPEPFHQLTRQRLANMLGNKLSKRTHIIDGLGAGNARCPVLFKGSRGFGRELPVDIVRHITTVHTPRSVDTDTDRRIGLGNRSRDIQSGLEFLQLFVGGPSCCLHAQRRTLLGGQLSKLVKNAVRTSPERSHRRFSRQEPTGAWRCQSLPDG